MKHTSILFTGLVLLLLSSGSGYSDNPKNLEGEENEWICEGYCFLGGDVPTDPFQPISATGATEQEARDNIDCGPYTETGITCRKASKASTRALN